jgi:hypothetical protein
MGIEFNQNVPTIDASEMTNLTLDVFFPDPIPGGSALTVILRDFGPNGEFGTPGVEGIGDDTVIEKTVRPTTNPPLVSGQWVTIDLDISGMANKTELGQIILQDNAGPALRGASFYVDNIYLYDNTAE